MKIQKYIRKILLPVAADLQSDAIEYRDFKSLHSLLRITTFSSLP